MAAVAGNGASEAVPAGSKQAALGAAAAAGTPQMAPGYGVHPGGHHPPPGAPVMYPPPPGHPYPYPHTPGYGPGPYGPYYSAVQKGMMGGPGLPPHAYAPSVPPQELIRQGSQASSAGGGHAHAPSLNASTATITAITKLTWTDYQKCASVPDHAVAAAVPPAVIAHNTYRYMACARGRRGWVRPQLLRAWPYIYGMMFMRYVWP